MAKQHDDTEGVPVRLDSAPDHRADGVAVAIPEDVSEQSESKSTAKSAASKKEQ